MFKKLAGNVTGATIDLDHALVTGVAAGLDLGWRRGADCLAGFVVVECAVIVAGIAYENGRQIDAVGVQQAVERLVVELLPNGVTIGRENQCVADAVKVDGPVLRIRVLWVAETAEILGVAAMGLPILGLDC